MTAKNRGIALLEEFCVQAASRYGADWPRILADVEQRLDGLDADVRAEVMAEFRAMMAQPPHPSDLLH